jgi:hypothetical protein
MHNAGYELFIRWTVFVVLLAFTRSGLAWCTIVGYTRRRRTHDGSIPLVLLQPMPHGRVRAERAVAHRVCKPCTSREKYILLTDNREQDSRGRLIDPFD